jgi:malate permease and related proteins
VTTFTVVLTSVGPVFAVIAVGYFFGLKGKLDTRPFVDWVIYVAQPSLIIIALTRHAVSPNLMLYTGLGNLFVLASVALLAWAYARWSGDRGREVFLCAIFGNTANIPLPLALFAFGAEGLAHQVVYMSMNALILYTVGVAIASGGRKGLSEVFKLPLVYAAVAGAVLSLNATRLPLMIERPVAMLGDTAIPLMLFTLGHKLGTVRAPAIGRAVPVAALRILGGLAAGVAFVFLFDPPLAVKRAVLLACCMPAAVQTFLLSIKFSGSSARSATVVMVSTTASLLYIPLLIAWLSTMTD